MSFPSCAAWNSFFFFSSYKYMFISGHKCPCFFFLSTTVIIVSYYYYFLAKEKHFMFAFGVLIVIIFWYFRIDWWISCWLVVDILNGKWFVFYVVPIIGGHHHCSSQIWSPYCNAFPNVRYLESPTCGEAFSSSMFRSQESCGNRKSSTGWGMFWTRLPSLVALDDCTVLILKELNSLIRIMFLPEQL